MKPDTARTLTVLSCICITIGVLANSPSLAFLLMLISAAASFPVVFAPRPYKIWGVVLLAISIMLGIAFYGKFRAEQDSYRRRAHDQQSVR